MENKQIIEYGSHFLHGFCIGLPFLCIDFLAVGVFQATGMGKEAFLFAVLRKIVLEIPALFLLNLLFPLYGLAYAQFTAELILAAAASHRTLPAVSETGERSLLNKRPAKAIFRAFAGLLFSLFLFYKHRIPK